MGFFSSFFSKMGQSPIAFGRVGAPTITSGNFTMNEGDTTCGTLTATDPNGLDVTFSVRSGVDASLFEITGAGMDVLSFKDAPDFDNPLDADGNNVYYVQVKATNTQGRYALKFVTVTVQNVAAFPGDILLSATTVSESAIVGTEIGTLTAPGLTGDITYSLVTGENDDHNASFAIDGDKLETGALLNYEAVSRMNVRVKATNGTTDIEASFTITVTNVAEAPTNIILSKNTMDEGNEIGDVVADLFIVHQELSSPIPDYALVVGTGDTDNAAFSIDGTQLKAEVVFDYETKTSYQFRLSASTGGGPAYEKAFTLLILNVNEAPVITSGATFNVLENTTFVCTVTATDPESQAITYSIQGSQPPNKFTIGSATGTLSFASAPDFETPGGINGTNEYKVIVQATDIDGLYATKEITVNVTDVNESDIYVDYTNGSDGNNGTLAHPYKTIAKGLIMASAGKTVYLRAGTYPQDSTIYIQHSGVNGGRITLRNYPGETPVVSGFRTLSGWTDPVAGIRSVAVASYPGIVTIDGSVQGIGRFPKSGYSTYETASGTSWIRDTSLAASPVWTGAEVVIRKAHWVLDRCTVTSHSGNTINYTGGSSEPGHANFGYFFQNDIKCCTELGDWYYSGGRLYMYFGAADPASYVIKVPQVTNLVNTSGKDYMTIDGLTFEGANSNGIVITGSDHFTVQNCTINKIANVGVYVQSGATNWYLYNNTESDCLNNGIQSDSDCNIGIITGNTLDEIGQVPGMGGNGNNSYQGILTENNNADIQWNVLSNIGYIGIHARYTVGSGGTALVKNNFIDTFCNVKDDGAGIYTFGPNVLKTIESNIVINGVGAGEGTNSESSANGIYCDDTSQNVVIASNTVKSCINWGIYIHNSNNIQLLSNNLYDNKVNIAFVHGATFAAYPIVNITMTSNQSTCIDPEQKHIYYYSDYDDYATFLSTGSFDSNAFAHVNGDDAVVTLYTYLSAGSGKETRMAFSVDGWGGTNNKTTPVFIPRFTTSSLVATNKFTNGNFDTVVTGTSTGWYGTDGVAATSWDDTDKIAGGSCKTTVTSESAQYNTIPIETSIGSIAAAKEYVVRFSVIGKADKTVGMYIRLSGAPYTILTPTHYFKVDDARINHEFLLTPATTGSATLAFIAHDDDCPFYIDNVRVYESDSVVTDPADYVVFGYNETDETKTVSFTGTYYYFDGSDVTSSVNLLPFESVVLFKPATASSIVDKVVSGWKLDDVSGHVQDVTGANDSTSETGITYGVNGIVSKAITFSAGDAIRFGNPANLQFDTTFSISAWIYPTSNTGYRTIVSKQNLDDTKNGYSLYCYAGSGSTSNLVFEIADAVDRSNVYVYNSLNNNTWYHIVATYDGVTMKVYINGVLQPTTATTRVPVTTVSDFLIGAYIDFGAAISSSWVGKICEVYVSDNVFTSDEVLALYNLGDGKTYPFN